MNRPRIAIPGRFTESASALRYRGLVSARALLQAIWSAGGDPVTLLPGDDADAVDWARRLDGFQGVLLPGGGDVIPTRYGQSADDPSLYDMDQVQDESDFTLAAYALDQGIPLLAVCRGLHVVNAALGGTLVIDMHQHHRHHRHVVELDDPSGHLGIGRSSVTASCYHHQAIDHLADRMVVLGRSADGYVEAAAIEASGWAAAVQWHPEDTAHEDPDQQRLFTNFVDQARQA